MTHSKTPFPELSGEAFHNLPPIYQLIQPMPSTPMSMASCSQRRSRFYLCEPPVKPISRLTATAPSGVAP